MPGCRDKNNKRKTSVKKKTCNPIFEEAFRVNTAKKLGLPNNHIFFSYYHI